MLDKVIENNRVCIIGEVVSEFTFSHEVFGEGFYIANVSVNRLSDMVDIIPLMISERLLDVWVFTKNYKYKELPVGFMEDEHWGRKINNFLKRKFLKKHN